MKILGIDSGLSCTGWGVIEFRSVTDISYISSGTIRTKSLCHMEVRLKTIYDCLTKVIEDNQPKNVAMEEVFVNINPASSKKLIMARTAAYLACCCRGYLMNEFSPNTIKKNITGNGHASKEQVSLMIQKLLRIDAKKSVINAHDVTDALATAVCCAFCANQYGGPCRTRTYDNSVMSGGF